MAFLPQTRQANNSRIVGVQPTTPPSDPIPVTLTGGASGVQQGYIFNQAILATTNFFPVNLAPTYSPTRFRIYITMDVAGVLSLIRTSGTPAVSLTENLNAGTNLTANASYIFDVVVTSADAINLRYSIGGTILSCIVEEVGA